MFFIVSKIFESLFAPLQFALLLSTLGVLLLFTRYARYGRTCAAVGVFTLMMMAFSPLGAFLAAPLENRFPAPPEDMPAPDGIIVLGGAIDEMLSERRGRPILIDSAAERLTAPLALKQKFPKARIIFTGGSAALPYADHFFNEKLQIPVEFFNPFRNITLGPGIDREKLAAEAYGYGGAVGLGLRLAAGECPIEVNLLPPYVIERREFNKKKIYFFGCAVGLALVSASWGYYFKERAELEQKLVGDTPSAKDTLQFQIQTLRRFESQITRQQKNVERSNQIKDQIKRLAEARVRWHQILEDLTQRLPADTWIIQLQPASGGVPIGPLAGGVEVAPPPPVAEGAPPGLPEPGRPPAAQKEQQITELLIVGGSINKPTEPERLQKPTEFLTKLRESAHFDEKATNITKGPTPKEGDMDFTFSITAQLKVPIPL